MVNKQHRANKVDPRELKLKTKQEKLLVTYNTLIVENDSSTKPARKILSEKIHNIEKDIYRIQKSDNVLTMQS